MKRYLIVLLFFFISCVKYNSSVTKNIEKYGVVQEKFINKIQQYEKSIKLANGEKLGVFNWCNVDTTLYSYVEIGDSIVKRKGEFSLFVYKPTGKVKEFKYMDGKGKVYDNKEAL